MKKKCIVIGANGYIGKHLVYFLSKMKIYTECYDKYIGDKSTKYIDLLDKHLLAQVDFNVDYIFFFSGLTGTHKGFDEYKDFVDINEVGLLNLLDIIRHSEYRPQIIFPSTRLIYKGIDSPLSENAEKETKTIYAVNKLACEGFLYSYLINFNIPYTIFRICVPYGNIIDNNYSFGTIGFLISQAKTNGTIRLYGDGSLKRTFTYIEDLCCQIIKASLEDKSKNEIFNIGGEMFSLYDIAILIAKKIDAKIEFVPWPNQDLCLESGHTFFDDSKIQLLLQGYSYHKLEEMLFQLS